MPKVCAVHLDFHRALFTYGTFVDGDYYMSEKLYNACNNKKQLVRIHDAQHGISYLKDPVKYIDALNDFFSNN